MFKKKRVYLDYAAATPLSPEAKAAMKPYFDGRFANPSAIHTEGQTTRTAVEAARSLVAKTIQVRPEFVTFTSGGTEANNLALLGTVLKLVEDGNKFSDMEIVTTRIEHPSVTNVMKSLERRGVIVKYVGINEDGLVNLEELRTLLSEKTVLFSVAYANSEIGTVQKVHAIKKVLDEAEKKYGTTIMFHLDAAQAPLWLSCQFDSLKADLISFDVGKCNGPKGVGILVRSRRAHIAPHVYGGGQEDGLRPGTENVMGIVGGAAAFASAQKSHKERAKRVVIVRDEGISMLTKLEGVVLNGSQGEYRIANNINISIPGLDTEFLTVVLDTYGFAVSTKSACAGAGSGESVVVREVTQDSSRAKSTLRLTLGSDTSSSDIKKVADIISHHIKKMSKLTQK